LLRLSRLAKKLPDRRPLHHPAATIEIPEQKGQCLANRLPPRLGNFFSVHDDAIRLHKAALSETPAISGAPRSQFIFPANRARATRLGCAVFCAAGANCRNDTHPTSINRNAVPGTELSIPLPMTAVVNEINKYIRASRSERRQGFFSFGSGLNITQRINAIQMRRPGMPSSSMIRPYSFSRATTFFRR